MYTNIVFEKNEGIARITLNRPDVLNALNLRSYQEISDAISQVEYDAETRVVIIGSTGRAFCAGADLGDIGALVGTPGGREELRRLVITGNNTYNAIEQCSRPVIVAIQGMALAGGLELVASCDIAIADRDARLGDQHSNFGAIPGGGDSQRLPRLIGIRKAMELLLTGDWISGSEAERLGLVNRAVPAAELESTVMELAKKLAKRNPGALRTIKNLVHQGMQSPLWVGLELEKANLLYQFTTADTQEGIKALKEKREAHFKGI